MSADLFAAFGPRPPLKKANEDKNEDNDGPAPSPDILIAGIETLDIQSQRDLNQKPARTKQQDHQRLWRQSDGGTTVLFDATEDLPDRDDDFGDFEDPNATGENRTASHTAAYLKHEFSRDPTSSDMLTHDLLGLAEDINTIGHRMAPSSKPHSVNTAPASDVERAAAKTSDEDDWGDFSVPPTTEIALAARRI